MCTYRLPARAATLTFMVIHIPRNEETILESGEGRGERVLGVIRNLNYTEYYSICGYLKPQPTIWQNNKI